MSKHDNQQERQSRCKLLLRRAPSRAGLIALWIILATTGTSESLQAQIVNGDFSSGDFTGWTLFAEDQSSVPTTPLIEVATLTNGFAANLPTGQFDQGVFFQVLEQSYTVNPDRPILSFDISLATWSLDPTGDGNSPFIDELFVTVGSNPVDQIEVILVDRFGLLADPLGVAAGLVTIGFPSQGDDFDTGVSVDLSQFAGQVVTLTADSVQEDDGAKFDQLLVGNFGMHPVPEPNTLGLFAWALLITAFPWAKRLMSARG